MEATLAILNELETSGLVGRYAIGGAMAAFFYAEAVVTEDLDAFVLLTTQTGGLVTLTPLYDFLKQRGATEERNTSGSRARSFSSFPLTTRSPRKLCAKLSNTLSAPPPPM